MATQICPICKKGANHDVVSWVRCPRFAAPVCMEHCNECRFFSGYETSVVHCYFGSNDEPNTKKKTLSKDSRLKQNREMN